MISVRRANSLIVAIAVVTITAINTLFSCTTLADKPQRIVSLSLCTDQLLLMLVDKKRIAALSHLATDPLYSYLWQQALGIPKHSNQVEEIIPRNPDLIVAASFNRGNSRQMLQRLGYNIVSIATPTTFIEVEKIVRQMGEAVQEQTKAEKIIKTMHADIAKAKQLIINKPSLLALSYGPNGYTPGSNTIKNEVLKTVGFRNLAEEAGINNYGNISLEQLVVSNPDVIIFDENTSSNQNSVAQRFVNHPVLTRLLKDKQHITLPMNYWICPGPISSKATIALAEQRQ